MVSKGDIGRKLMHTDLHLIDRRQIKSGFADFIDVLRATEKIIVQHFLSV